MAKLTGKNLAFTLGGVAYALPLEWELTDEDITIERKAAGETVMDRDSVGSDWTFTARGIVEIAAPYVLPTALRGTKAAILGKLVSSHTNNFLSTTGLFTRFHIHPVSDNYVEWDIEAKAAGTALTYSLLGT